MAELNYNIEAQVEFLVNLLNTPSPTGYYVEAVEYMRRAFMKLEIPRLSIAPTPKGALLAVWEGERNSAPRGVTAHSDTLGLMVKEIKSSGRLKVTNIGGIVWNSIEHENVTIRTHDGQRYRGTVIPENPSSHVNREIDSQKRNADKMEVRIDAKTTSADETRELGIEVGDFVFLDPRVEVTDTGFIRSRFLDDKAGIANIYGALLALKDAGLRPAQDTAFLMTSHEEVGHGGVAGWPFELTELLAIDMASLGDGQSGDEFSVSICVKDSGGPYDFLMNNKLRRLAETYDVQYKVDIYPYYGSDGTAYWRSGGGGRVGLIGPGVASSHAYERTHEEALLHSTDLLARYLLDEEV